MEKNTRKTGKKTGRFAKGADPRRGVGKRGRSGRKPNAFVQACSELTDTVVLAKARAYLHKSTPRDTAWQWCARFVASYGKGLPVQPVDLTAEHEEALEDLA